jgi:hypothetical protein
MLTHIEVLKTTIDIEDIMDISVSKHRHYGLHGRQDHHGHHGHHSHRGYSGKDRHLLRWVCFSSILIILSARLPVGRRCRSRQNTSINAGLYRLGGGRELLALSDAIREGIFLTHANLQYHQEAVR